MLERADEVEQLYRDFDDGHLVPLWTQVDELMGVAPPNRTVAFLWRWSDLLPLARRAGELIPVGRGGERRAIALANPGLGGRPFVTPTLWAAIQYLGPGETAPEHRHSQNAFRFVVEGDGVWTVVNGDPVAMRRGDLLLTPGWQFHGHHNYSDRPMAWIDGLDIPFAHYTESGFFEAGRDRLASEETPPRCRGERLWGHPGLRPLSLLRPPRSSPLPAYRWEHTDRALCEQLALEEEGYPVTLAPGHAAVRYVNPATGGDVLPTIRAEFHRLREGIDSVERREVGSSVWQVFDGSGAVVIDGASHTLSVGDLFLVPSWSSFRLQAESGMDLFRFTDSPIFEALGLHRVQVGDRDEIDPSLPQSWTP